jgi:competence protein ComEA
LIVALLAWGAFAADAGKKKDKARELFEDICSYCHNLNKVQGQHLDRDEWSDLIKGMISEGAPVTDEEFSMIVDYLAKNFGRKDSEKR